MLIMSRKFGEEILIGTDPPVGIMVTHIDRGKVQIGVTVDRTIPVYRREIAPADVLALFDKRPGARPPGEDAPGTNQADPEYTRPETNR